VVAVSNSSGVRSPRALWSRVPLYQPMYSTTAARAAARVVQGCWSRHPPSGMRRTTRPARCPALPDLTVRQRHLEIVGECGVVTDQGGRQEQAGIGDRVGVVKAGVELV
jgi:hypothetical protein